MTNQPNPKPSFDDFVKTCTPLLKIPELELQMKAQVRNIMAELFDFKSDSDSISNLKQFLKKDEKFLGVLLALTNLSQEKFLRIISAERFAKEDFGAEWGAKYIYKKLNKDDEFAESIAKLFIEGRDNQLLISSSAFAVTKIKFYQLAPNDCNILADITASSAGTITFYWVQSGVNGNVRTQVFSAAGTFTSAWTMPPASTHTMSIYVDVPNHATFGGISFTCT